MTADEPSNPDPFSAAASPETSDNQKPVPSESATQTEESLWVGRTSWKHFGGLIAAWSLGSLLLLVVTVGWLGAWWKLTFAAIFLAAVAVVARIAVTVFSTRYELTTERLFIERGLLSLTRDQTELIRVDDVRVRKRLMDRIFGLGSIDVLSTDVTDRSLVIEGVADADRVAELVRTYMRKARKKSLFIESL